MKGMPTEPKARIFLIFLLVLQFTMYALMLFDIPVARQIIGFVYFTTIPGYIIVKLLKLNELDTVEVVLFSVGFSIAFLMFAGLLTNQLCFLLGFSEPLSLFPLAIVLNTLILTGAFIVYLRKDDIDIGRFKVFGMSPLTLLFLILPVLSIAGAIWVNTFRNNMILLFMITAIALITVAVILKKMLPSRLYPLAVLMIAISLLFHSSLISNYIVTFGSDIHIEYFVLKTTENSAYWNSSNPFFGDKGYQRLNAMLSVTILPNLYSTLLNLDATWVVKILFPLIYSFVPLALYQVWQKYISKKYAFISTFLFMAECTFYTEILGLNRQIVAELFFVLLLLVALNKKMKHISKILCFMIFSVAFITSHYALAEIFLFFVSLACISSIAIKRPSKNITVTMVVFFFVVMFSWYLYISNSATFDSIVSYGNYVYEQLDQFFNPLSRGETVLRGLGLERPLTIWNTLSRTFAYVTEFFIVLGFLGLITRRIKIQLEIEYFALTIIAAAFLVALIAVPGLADTMNMTRFYHILLFFLAPLCVLGVEFFVNLFFKRKKEVVISVLLVIVLVPYFLFQTNFVYEVTGSESWSIALSSYRMDRSEFYLIWGYSESWCVSGAQWLHANMHTQSKQVYTDLSPTHTLIAYGYLYGGNILFLSNTTEVSAKGTIFLSPLNVIDRKIVTNFYSGTLDELNFIDDMNKIYANGGSEIYRNPLGN